MLTSHPQRLEAQPAHVALHRITVAVATPRDRKTIARLRHAVYARELGQHAPTILRTVLGERAVE